MPEFDYPYSTAFFMDTLGVETVEFDIVRFDEYDSQGTGHDMQSEMADPKWTARMTMRPHQNLDARKIAAKARKLDGSALTFMVYDPQNPYPYADPLGEWLAYGSNLSVGATSLDYDFVAGTYEIDGNDVSVSSAVSCVRASTGFAQDSADIWQAFGVNAARITDAGLFIEPASINRVTLASNANPTVTTGITTSGDAAAVLSVVDDVAELALAGLANICTSGKVYKLDNSLAVAATQALISVNNSYSVGQFVGSVWARGSGNGRVRNSTQTPAYAALSANYVRLSFQSATTPVSATACRVQVEAGAIIYFILPQFEVGTVPSSPIITAGAIATRAADAVTVNLPSGTHDLALDYQGGPQSVVGQTVSYAVPNVTVATLEGVTAIKTAMLPAVPATVQVNTIGANNTSLSLKGLPAGYVITIGDKGQINYGDNVFFFEFSESISANGSGVTAAVEIFPHVDVGIAVDQNVILAKPACKMSIMPDGFSPGRSKGPITNGVILNALEHV